jgi:hypothetical protein
MKTPKQIAFQQKNKSVWNNFSDKFPTDGSFTPGNQFGVVKDKFGVEE